MSDDFGIRQEVLPLDDKNVFIRSTQDTSYIFDANKQAHLHGDGFSPSKDFKHVARIPLIVAMKWLNEEGIDVLNPDHKDAVRRKLNSIDYAYLRTGSGTLGRNSRGD